jgi:hypothetical protein
LAQLQIVTLGGLLGRWRISSRDYLSAAEWFKLLWTRIATREEDIKSGDFSEFGWLRHFVIAVTRLLAPNDQDDEQNLVLLKH